MEIPPTIAQIAPDGRPTPRQIRRFLIDLGLRKQKLGTGSSHEFMLRRTALTEWPDLRDILKGIDWVLVGGVATRAYMPERATKDMDILVREIDGEEVIERLGHADWRKVSRLTIPGFLMKSPYGVQLDVLFGAYEWIEEALATHNYDPAGYPVLGFPFLVLMKMSTGRGRDHGDTLTMLGWNDDVALDEVRRVVARYSPEDSADLEAMIYLGRLERETPNWD